MIYDVFNGDADGITSLIQLRLAEPKNSELITGVKRDISLLKKFEAKAGDEITVLDISLAKNTVEAIAALEKGATIFYVDHHAEGDGIQHENFNAKINMAPDVCTSLLINGYLNGAFPEWAIVGAFGDNLKDSARRLSKKCDLDESEINQLDELGVLINYNGYGLTLGDLHFSPADLYQELVKFASPFTFIRENQAVFLTLKTGYADDMQNAQQTKTHFSNNAVSVYILPEASWARRVNGVWGNALANQAPDVAHAVLVEKPDGSFVVSVRAPLNNKQGAGALCSKFATGGGREAAAGINALKKEELDTFIKAFSEYYG